MAVDFDTYAYTADSAVKHPIKIAVAAALAQVTTASNAGITSSISARVGGSRRALGLHCRGVRLRRQTGTGVNTKSFFTFLPILTAGDYGNAAFNQGAAVTLNGVAYTCSKRVPEVSN